MEPSFTLELQDFQRWPLPHVTQGSQAWFVAEPGREFQVAMRCVNPAGKIYQFDLSVDGTSVGYCKYVYGDRQHSAVHWVGWLQYTGSAAAGSSSDNYKAFKCRQRQPLQAAHTGTRTDASTVQAGRVVVSVTEVVSTGQHHPSVWLNATAPGDDTGTQPTEGKKWFQAPTLQAEAGSVKTFTTDWDTTVYQTVATLPSLQVRYDSSEALYLRKALNPRFAPHRAILRQSANPVIKALANEPTSTQSSMRSPAAAAAAEAMKREAGTPPGHGAAAAAAGGGNADAPAGAAEDNEYVPRSATAADRVDLTEEPVRPMTVNGRQLAPDELAVCDLCDSDEDDAPTWQVRKKQQIEVLDTQA